MEHKKEHKEEIALYLSGLAGKKAERRTENALMRDAGFLQSFIDTAEQHLCAAPPGFADAVMRLLPSRPAVTVKVPMLSRKLCAAVCFCSAAAILLLSFSGLDRHIMELIAEQSGKLTAWMALSQNFTLGGY
ncbi:MAG: hypothetical protein FWF04_05675 [Clostridiales bacterium]|nr:hypothetical protein [Clostridiales bacterium]